METKSEIDRVHPVERFMAMLVAGASLGITAVLWWSISRYQPMWPLPALYFIEVVLLCFLSAWLFSRGRQVGMRFVWAVVGALFIFSFLGALSVGVFFLAFPVVLFSISLSNDIRNRGNVLVHFGMLFIGGLIQLAIMLGAVGLSQISLLQGASGNGAVGVAFPATTEPSGNITTMEYRNENLGFSLMYPSNLQLTENPDGSSALLLFPLNTGTNVSSEKISMDFSRPLPCTSSLAEGRDPSTLDGREVVLDGIPFLRQSFTGAAAGSTHTLVSYAGTIDSKCIVFNFELVTFDPANLDPTAFPNPPVAIDSQAQVDLFDSLMSTFTSAK
jgi:hypothetical protein